jgi:hypothetical protein
MLLSRQIVRTFGGVDASAATRTSGVSSSNVGAVMSYQHGRGSVPAQSPGDDHGYLPSAAVRRICPVLRRLTSLLEASAWAPGRSR